MDLRVPNSFPTVGIAAAGLFFVWGAFNQSSGGEPVRFTDPPATFPQLKTDSPMDKQAPWLGLKDSFNSKDAAGRVAAPAFPTPTVSRSPWAGKRMEEFLERKRNWIFNSPGKGQREPTAEDFFSVRKFDPDNRRDEPYSAIRDFFDSFDRKQKPPTQRTDDEREKSDSARKKAGAVGPSASPGRVGVDRDKLSKSEVNLNRLFDSKAGNDHEHDPFRAPTSLGDFSLQEVLSSTELRGALMQEKTRRKQFLQQLLSPSFNGGPPGGGNDLINLQVDLTRQPLQPVAPLGGSLFDPSRSGPLDVGRGLGTANPSRAAGILGARGGSVVPASVATSLQPLPASPRAKPQPPMLKFPDRVY